MRALGLALLAGILGEILKLLGWRGAPAVAAMALVGAVSVFGDTFASLAQQVTRLSSLGDITRYAEAVMKIIAVGLLSGVVSDMLSELSGAGPARIAAAAGKFEILAIALPFLNEIIDTGLSLISY